MTDWPWLPIGTAPDDGRPVFVWNGDYRWATWRVPVFHPDPEHEGETWCEDRLPMVPQPTHWLPLSPPDDSTAPSDHWTVTAHCWRRGPGGSIACYALGQSKAWTRCYEHEGSATISDETAEAVVSSMVQQLVSEVFPKLLYAVLGAQGADPDRGRRDQVPDA
jgi:hypothetical protein